MSFTLQLDVTHKLWELVDVLLTVRDAEDAMSSPAYDWWAEHGGMLITVSSRAEGEQGTCKSSSESFREVSEVWASALRQLAAIDHPRRRDAERAWEAMTRWCDVHDVAEEMEALHTG